MTNSGSRKTGYLIGAVSVAANLFLFALKYWSGTRSGSIAMAADAWHTLSDSFTSLVVIVGFRLSSLPRDREHPFGHGRAESVAAVVIGTLLAVVGAGFIRESAHQLRSGDAADFSTLSVVVFAASVVVKEAMASVSIRVGRRMKSQALVADGWHHRSDAIASAIVLAGILLGRRIAWIDGVLGIVVSCLILYAAWGIVKDASHDLLGEEPPEEIVRYARQRVSGSPHGISGIHRVSFHRYGEHKEMVLHAVMPDTLGLVESHRLATALERDLLEKFDVVATVHAEPESEGEDEDEETD